MFNLFTRKTHKDPIQMSNNAITPLGDMVIDLENANGCIRVAIADNINLMDKLQEIICEAKQDNVVLANQEKVNNQIIGNLNGMLLGGN